MADPWEDAEAYDPATGKIMHVVGTEEVWDSYGSAPPRMKRWLAKNRQRLDEAATRHLPSSPRPVTIDLSTTPSKGDLMPRDWTPDPATDKQTGYLSSLLSETVALQTKLKEKGVPHVDELLAETEKVHAAASKRIDEGTFTKGNASQAIDFVVDMNRKLTARLRAYGDGSHTIFGRETKTRVTEDGMYQDPATGTVWRVQYAKQGSGRLYAKRLSIVEAAKTDADGKIVKPAKGKFVYQPGGLRSIDPAWKMSLEQAKDFGALYGMCCVCCATLTAEQSIEDGIGPVCGKRFTDDPPLFDVPATPTTEGATP